LVLTQIIDSTVRPVRITRFEYEFDVWLGDPLVEAIGCFIITSSVARTIAAMQPTGVSFGPVEVSKSGVFEDLYGQRTLPSFVWLQVKGKAGRDDFGLSAKRRLVVSQRILDMLVGAGMSHCTVKDYAK